VSDGKLGAGYLFGRERETSLLDGLVDHIEEQGAALLVHGEAGIGKSSLLEHARERRHAECSF
jgi:ABC-type transport system involved in cytochrome c biogenesis ATPase subunit